MKRFLVLLPAVAFGLAACSSSAPVHYHTLMPPPAAAAPDGPPAPFVFEVLPVGIPAQVDQAQMVVHAPDGSLALLDGERWAGPLADEIRASLSADLARRLGTQDVAGLARPAGRQVLRIKVQVRRLDAWPGQRVQMDADWSMGAADDGAGARLACHGRFEQAAPGGYQGLAEAQQRSVAQLAGRIAQDARNWAGGRASDCAG